MSNERDERKYMKLALALAARGRGMTHPNPMVGAVVVKGGKVIGRGYHRGPYTPHAEVVAIEQAGKGARGADLYVTLEPCNHRGRTPPCSEAILRAGVKRVFAATRDTNIGVRGGGMSRLRKAGIAVETGLEEERARELNAAYFKYVETGRPLVIVKAAITADGKVAARSGASRWITGEAARRMAHRLRRESDAVVVGSGTVAADDPELTVRMVPLRGARTPLRVVVDSRLSIPLGCKLAGGGEPRVVVATTRRHDARKARQLEKRGVEVMVMAERQGRVDLDDLLERLAGMGVAQVLVEGGPTLASSFIAGGYADRLVLFVAPRAFGDADAPAWLQGRAVEDPAQGIAFAWTRIGHAGEDIVLEAELKGGR